MNYSLIDLLSNAQFFASLQTTEFEKCFKTKFKTVQPNKIYNYEMI